MASKYDVQKVGNRYQPNSQGFWVGLINEVCESFVTCGHCKEQIYLGNVTRHQARHMLKRGGWKLKRKYCSYGAGGYGYYWICPECCRELGCEEAEKPHD